MIFFPIDHTIWIIHNSYFQGDLEQLNMFLCISKDFYFKVPSAQIMLGQKYLYSLMGNLHTMGSIQQNMFV